MDRTEGIAVSPDGNVFVTGTASNSVAMVNVITKSSPVGVGGVTSASCMAGARRVAVSSDGKYLIVPGYTTASLAVVVVTAKNSPKVVGCSAGSAYLTGASGVAASPDGKYLFVMMGYLANSCALVDVCTANSPVVAGAVVNSVYMGGASEVGSVARRQVRVCVGLQHALCGGGGRQHQEQPRGGGGGRRQKLHLHDERCLWSGSVARRQVRVFVTGYGWNTGSVVLVDATTKWVPSRALPIYYLSGAAAAWQRRPTVTVCL